MLVLRLLKSIDDNPQGPWITTRPHALKALSKIMGRAAYRGRVGAHAGGANGIYWVRVTKPVSPQKVEIENLHDIGRNKYAPVAKVVEKALIYPLLRGRDVSRWASRSSISIILPYDRVRSSKAYEIQALKSLYPGVLSYFESFKNELLERTHYEAHFAAQGAPYYSMYNVGEYTFSPYKVVWKEQSTLLQCAVVSSIEDKVVIPDHKLMLVPFQNEHEAHFVCALLNSTPSQFLVRAYTISTQQSTHILNNVKVPEYSKANSTHKELARLSQKCHEKAAAGIDLSDLETQIDELAAELWGLPKDELAEIKDSLEELQ